MKAASSSVARSWRFRVWAVVLAATAGALAFVPLFWVLGFESAFVLALLGSLGAMDLGVSLVARLRRAQVSATARALTPLPLVLGLWARAALLGLALLLAPLAILCLNAFRVRNCDFLFGLEAYAALPAASAVLAAGVGVVMGLLVPPRRRKLAAALPYLALAASALYSLWRFYAAPPVFSYNIFAGYFPGNLYDEAIDLGAPLLWARFYQLALVSGALAAVAAMLDVPAARPALRGPRRPQGWRVGPMAMALLSLSVALSLGLESGALGFDIDSGDIQEALGSKIETEHFTIYYPGGVISDDEIAFLAEDHEFRLAQAERTLGAKPGVHITSFLFADAAAKQRFVGARNVHMAKPWRREIYVNYAPFPHPILRHEIAHVVAGAFGDSIFGVSARGPLGLPLRFNVGLIEGLAVAADWPDHFTNPLTPHQSVKALTELGMAPPLSSLLSTGFLTVSSARSYTVAGSFVRYLLETYGAAKLHALYRSGGDFAAVYGVSFAELEAGWRRLIDATPLPPGAAKVVEERFRHRSIFFRKCPHAIARARQRAADLTARGHVEEAVRVMRQVCDDVPGEPRFLLELGGMLERAGQRTQADAIYASIAGDVEHVSSDLRARALIRRAELAVAGGERDAALALLDRAAALPVVDELERLASIEALAMRHQGPAGDALRRYFWGTPPERTVDIVASVARAALALAAEPDSGLAHYLVGFNLRYRGAPADATAALSKALELGLPPLARREAARLLAEVGYMAKRYDAVERAAAILVEPEQPRVLRLYGADWMERLYWKKHGELPAKPIRPEDVPTLADEAATTVQKDETLPRDAGEGH